MLLSFWYSLAGVFGRLRLAEVRPRVEAETAGQDRNPNKPWRVEPSFMLAVTAGGNLVHHHAFTIYFGDEPICTSLDNQPDRMNFLAEAANDKMATGEYYFPDGPRSCLKPLESSID